MRKITLLAFLTIYSLGFAQTFPLDFESTTTTYSFTNFDGGVATKIANPQISGINTSATVIQLVKGAGKVWAGSKITMAAPIDLTTDRVFKVKVFSPVAGIRLTLKFEGDGGPNSTYLFDDVTQSKGTNPILDLPVLPLDFESATTVTYPFSDFAGGVTTIMPNPYPTGINTSATVVRLVKNPGENPLETYAASVIQMAGPIDFSTNKIVKVKVWSPVAGKKLQLKFEGSPTDADNGAFETDATITKANEWEELTFDYSSPTLFPPVNNNDNKIVFFFDIATMGDGGPNSTYYFDDVAFSDKPSSLPSFIISEVKMYLNPVSNQLSIDANGEIQKVSVYNLLGKEVLTKKPNSNNTTLQTSGLQKGVYIAKATIDGKESTSKFTKK